MSTSMTLADQVVSAFERVRPFVRETDLQHSPFYSELCGANVYFKCENLQHTGSFKLRGALNKFLQLSPEQQSQGIVAASTGNHGKAVAYIARKFGVTATVFAPDNAVASKLEAIREMDADVQLAGSDCIEAEESARNFALGNSSIYISPYNDLDVIAGQGTIGFEICKQLSQVDALFASVGGGGMISGVAAFTRSRFPQCRIVGCSPDNSKVMIESLTAGKLLDLPSTETLSDGTAGGVEPDSITFDLCRELIDQSVTVSESEIAKQLVQFIDSHEMRIEGAAAVSIASLIKCREQFKGQNVVVILCGENISPEQLAKLTSSTQRIEIESP